MELYDEVDADRKGSVTEIRQVTGHPASSSWVVFIITTSKGKRVFKSFFPDSARLIAMGLEVGDKVHWTLREFNKLERVYCERLECPKYRYEIKRLDRKPARRRPLSPSHNPENLSSSITHVQRYTKLLFREAY